MPGDISSYVCYKFFSGWLFFKVIATVIFTGQILVYFVRDQSADCVG